MSTIIVCTGLIDLAMEGGGGARRVVSGARLDSRVFMPTQLGASSFCTQQSTLLGQGIKCVINRIKAHIAEILELIIDAQ